MSEPEFAPRNADAVPLETTALLLDRARGGDEAARSRLFARYVPVLTRWAHQRMPRRARDLAETGDIVQATLLRAFGRLETFESRGEGAFLGYLRQILLNLVRDEARRAATRRGTGPLPDQLADPAPSVLEAAVGADTIRRYESGLARLGDEQRAAVILKVEMGFGHAQIADALGKPSVDAARVMLSRALVQLARFMEEPGDA